MNITLKKVVIASGLLAASFSASAVSTHSAESTFFNSSETGSFYLSALSTDQLFEAGTAVFSFKDLSQYSLSSLGFTFSASANPNAQLIMTFYNPLDSASVSIAGQTAEGSNAGGYSSSSDASFISNRFITVNRVVNKTGYTGDFYVSVLLGQETRSSIQNGYLPFSFDIASGSARMTSASLNYSTVSAVPEPETYAMMLGGLGILGFVARRRKKQDAAKLAQN